MLIPFHFWFQYGRPKIKICIGLISYHLYMMNETPVLRIINHTDWDTLEENGQINASTLILSGEAAIRKAVELKILSKPEDDAEIRAFRSQKEANSVAPKRPVGRPLRGESDENIPGHWVNEKRTEDRKEVAKKRDRQVKQIQRQTRDEVKLIVKEKELADREIERIVATVKNPPKYRNEHVPVDKKRNN